VATHSETIQVSGIRCERCVMRLGKVLERVEGIESATANLMGQVLLSWDDQRTDREAIVAGLARGGFHELSAGN
jgi:copper chaperone CopZ